MNLCIFTLVNNTKTTEIKTRLNNVSQYPASMFFDNLEQRPKTSTTCKNIVDNHVRGVQFNIVYSCFHRRETKIVLFNRRNVFLGVGYAMTSDLCSQTRSCSIVYDHGFTSAFIAAHEVAHS